MSRQLRPRTSRVNYAALLDSEELDNGGPSLATYDEEGDSGSEFALEERAEPDPEESLPSEQEDEEMQNDNEPKSTSAQAAPLAVSQKRKKKSGPAADSAKAAVSFAPGLQRHANRQQYALSSPTLHHRQRPIPLFAGISKVERLLKPPTVFGPPKTAATNSFTCSSTVTDKLHKAFIYNVGPGPLWDLLEDRGWYKEAKFSSSSPEKEENRRPCVYSDVHVKDGWEALDTEHARPYLPSDVTKTETGLPSVTCSFGPYDRQKSLELQLFQSLNLCTLFPQSKSHVFNAGGPVWGLSWCPTHPRDRIRLYFSELDLFQKVSNLIKGNAYSHYLAIAPFPTRRHSPKVGVRKQRPEPGCIQIWSLRKSELCETPPAPVDGMEARHGCTADCGEMTCEMVLCLESGPAQEIRWCPLPSGDEKEGDRPGKLGILAGTFEDGSLSVYAVPNPADVMTPGHDKNTPIFVRISEPLVRIELEDATCWSLDWANSDIIAVGCSNGCIAVYNLAQAMKANSIENIFPMHYISVHQAAIRTIAWIRAPRASSTGSLLFSEDPAIIFSGGYDGVECLTDIREQHRNIMNRTRDVITCGTYSHWEGGPVTIDHENLVKGYSVSPAMLGRGHTILEPGGPIWSISASEYHPQLAVGVSDGCCITTNTMKAPRRGGPVGFFVYKIYQMDYSRNTGELRMLEHFLPHEVVDRYQQSRARTKENVEVQPVGSGVWPAEVAVHRVAWNDGDGLSGAPLFASATASGLCRVDWLLGRWFKDRMPYSSIEKIRGEVAAMDEDE